VLQVPPDLKVGELSLSDDDAELLSEADKGSRIDVIAREEVLLSGEKNGADPDADAERLRGSELLLN
jgi:hypothetical protein